MNRKPPAINCPECGKPCINRGVMLVGNVLTGEKLSPAWRMECPDCVVIVSSPVEDQDHGWALWKEQNPNWRPGR